MVRVDKQLVQRAASVEAAKGQHSPAGLKRRDVNDRGEEPYPQVLRGKKTEGKNPICGC